VLWLMAINLVLILLFPPFENYYAITKAVVPSFDGFYFLFDDNAQRQIVTTLLYLEVALVLINGGLLWLLFRQAGKRPALRRGDAGAGRVVAPAPARRINPLSA
jgi:hypothetical protein